MPTDPHPQRGSLVPRWLAWLVLCALLSAAACSVHSLLRSDPPRARGTGQDRSNAPPAP